MTAHISYKELILLINEIKQKNSIFYTNYYYNEEYFNNMKEINLIKFNNTMILLYDKQAFKYIYFWSNSLCELADALKDVKKDNIVPLIVEVLYKGNNKLEKYLLDINFKYYGGIQRLQKKINHNDMLLESKCSISYAVKVDIEGILSLHAKIFNKYIDRELTYKELLELINNGNVLLCKINGCIAGCLIYNKRGKFYHLHYWFANKDMEGNIKGVGKALLYKLYKIAGSGNFIEVWSRKDNQIVTEIYKRYGFKEDGLNSDVFVYSQDEALIAPLIPLN